MEEMVAYSVKATRARKVRNQIVFHFLKMKYQYVLDMNYTLLTF